MEQLSERHCIRDKSTRGQIRAGVHFCIESVPRPADPTARTCQYPTISSPRFGISRAGFQFKSELGRMRSSTTRGRTNTSACDDSKGSRVFTTHWPLFWIPAHKTDWLMKIPATRRRFLTGIAFPCDQFGSFRKYCQGALDLLVQLEPDLVSGLFPETQ